MAKLFSILVGAHFVPPAKFFLEHLPAGTSLRLEPDRENPYDENAIVVLVRPQSVPEGQRAELGVKIPGMGFDLGELLMANDWLRLGHVASSGGLPLLKARLVRDDLVGNMEFLAVMNGPTEASLAFDGSGLILVGLDENQPARQIEAHEELGT